MVALKLSHLHSPFLCLLVWTWCIMHPICLWRGQAFRPTGPGVGGGGGRGLLQTDLARHSRILTWPSPALPDFDRPGLAWGVGEGEVCYRQTRPDFSPAASLASPFLHPPKPPSQTQRLTKLIYMISGPCFVGSWKVMVWNGKLNSLWEIPMHFSIERANTKVNYRFFMHFPMWCEKTNKRTNMMIKH